MKGLFGGLLSIVHAIGGGVLYVLIGSKGWNESGMARWMRLAFGSLVIGIAVGVVILYLAQEPRSYESRDSSGYLCGFPALIFAFVMLLEMIRKALSGNEKK